MASILYKNALILKGEDFTPLNGFLGTAGTLIDYIGTERPEAAYDQEIDLKGAILLPALFNAHTHAAMTLLRGLGGGLPLERWLNERIFPTEARLTPAMVSAGNALALLEMLACGTVSFTDMYDFPQTAVELCLNGGMKINTGRPYMCFDENEKLSDSYRIREALALYDAYHQAGDGRVLIDFDLHAVYTNKKHGIQGFSELVREKGGRLNIHLSETQTEVGDCLKAYGMTPPALFASLGAFKNPTTAAHCVHVTPADREILRENGVFPVHNPTSNMKLVSGMSPVDGMLKQGIRVALGTDGTASNNNLNMFEEMHLAALMAKLQTGDAEALPARSVLTMATRNGALSQGREDSGVLEVGFRADLCAVSLEAPHLYPVLDPAELLVYSAQGSDVTLTVCDGKILYRDGEYLTLDKEKILYEARAAVKALYA